MRILIGYDGSGHADAALGDLKRAGLPGDSKVLVVSAADLLMSSPPPEGLKTRMNRRSARFF